MLNKPTEFISLDDLLHATYSNIIDKGVKVEGKRGDFKEWINYSATLVNPRIRTSMSLHRKLVQSKFAEFAWYLSMGAKRSYIQPYISQYEHEEQENNRILGAYGPKIFASDNGKKSQYERVIEQIKKREKTKQAYISISEKSEYKHREEKYESPPCTIGLHFYVREFKLNLTCYMRSNDAYFGLPHDLFCFTMLQELISCRTNIPMGIYTHCVTSMHIYDKHYESALKYISEGKQEPIQMPQIKECSDEMLHRVSKEFDPTITNLSPEKVLDNFWKDYVLYSRRNLNDKTDFDSWFSRFSDVKMKEIAQNSISK